MRWADERYVKLYSREGPDWLLLPWEARALFRELLTKVDRAGMLPLGKSGARGLALVVKMPAEVVEPALASLVDDGCVQVESGTLILRNFVEAQEARATPAARKRAEREAARDQVRATTIDVTRGHAESREVTRGHDPEEPSPAQPRSDQKLPSPSAPPLADVGTGPETFASEEHGLPTGPPSRGKQVVGVDGGQPEAQSGGDASTPVTGRPVASGPGTVAEGGPPTPAPPPKKKRKEPERPTDPRHAPFVAHFDARWLARCGTKFAWLPRDFRDVTALLALGEDSELRRRLDIALGDEFFRKRGRVEQLVAGWNGYATGPPPRGGALPPAPSGAYEGGPSGF